MQRESLPARLLLLYYVLSIQSHAAVKVRRRSIGAAVALSCGKWLVARGAALTGRMTGCATAFAHAQAELAKAYFDAYTDGAKRKWPAHLSAAPTLGYSPGAL